MYIVSHTDRQEVVLLFAAFLLARAICAEVLLTHTDRLDTMI